MWWCAGFAVFLNFQNLCGAMWWWPPWVGGWFTSQGTARPARQQGPPGTAHMTHGSREAQEKGATKAGQSQVQEERNQRTERTRGCCRGTGLRPCIPEQLLGAVGCGGNHRQRPTTHVLVRVCDRVPSWKAGSAAVTMGASHTLTLAAVQFGVAFPCHAGSGGGCQRQRAHSHITDRLLQVRFAGLRMCCCDLFHAFNIDPSFQAF
jgi:hypothetical protein